MTRDVGEARGILRHAAAGAGVFHHARIAPCTALADLVQHYWSVRWDLRGHPAQVRETLPHPNVHIVIREGNALVHGIHGSRFTTVLEGLGGAFGIKFRSGAFRALLGKPVSTLRDRSLAVEGLADTRMRALSTIDPVGEDDASKIAVAERILLDLRIPRDADALLAAEIVDAIAADRQLHTVGQLGTRCAIRTRSLQRLFNDHVGVGPKWVINRYRIHEVIGQLADGTSPDWSRLALDLGYFDQAHFIRDFKRLVGLTPSAYASIAAPRPASERT